MKNLRLHIPQYFNQHGIYYGWVIVVVGTLGIIMSIPGQTMGISIYTEYLLISLELERLHLSMAYMFGTLGSAALLPLAGKILDRWGARIMGVVATVGLAFSLTMLALSPQISQFITGWMDINPTWIALAVTFFCFLGIRHFGQGQLTMASRSMMGIWFEKKRGLILGISGGFVGFSFGIAPLILNKLIDQYQWQSSLFLLTGCMLGMAVLVWIFYRRSPEHCGLKIDGGSLKRKVLTDDELVPEYQPYTSAQARKTFTFWIFNLGMVIQALLVTAITFHLMDLASIHQMETQKAFSVFLPMSVMAITAEVIAGYFSDKIRIKYILSVMQAFLCLGLLSFQIFGTTLGFILVAIGLGVSSGLFALLNAVAWPKLFGRTYLGSIMGIVTACMVAGSAVGPYFFSLGKQIHGSYEMVIYLCTLLPLTIFVLSFFANNPRRSKVLH